MIRASFRRSNRVLRRNGDCVRRCRSRLGRSFPAARHRGKWATPKSPCWDRRPSRARVQTRWRRAVARRPEVMNFSSRTRCLESSVAALKVHLLQHAIDAAAADAQTLGDFSRAEPVGPQLADLSELRPRRWCSPLVLAGSFGLCPRAAAPSICSRSNAASAPIHVSGNAMPSNLASRPRQVS